MFLSVAVACTKNLFLWDIGTKLSCHLELGVQTQHLGCLHKEQTHKFGILGKHFIKP